jgi:hypothetical protein
VAIRHRTTTYITPHPRAWECNLGERTHREGYVIGREAGLAQVRFQAPQYTTATKRAPHHRCPEPKTRRTCTEAATWKGQVPRIESTRTLRQSTDSQTHFEPTHGIHLVMTIHHHIIFIIRTATATHTNESGPPPHEHLCSPRHRSVCCADSQHTKRSIRVCTQGHTKQLTRAGHASAAVQFSKHKRKLPIQFSSGAEHVADLWFLGARLIRTAGSPLLSIPISFTSGVWPTPPAAVLLGSGPLPRRSVPGFGCRVLMRWRSTSLSQLHSQQLPVQFDRRGVSKRCLAGLRCFEFDKDEVASAPITRQYMHKCY